MLEKFKTDKNFTALLSGLRRGAPAQNVEGLWGSSPSLLAAALYETAGGRILFVTAGEDEAEARWRELQNFVGGPGPGLFPPAEPAGFREGLVSDRYRRRLKTVSGLVSGGAGITVAPVRALLQKLLKAESVGKGFIEAETGGSLRMHALAEKLSAHGYERSREVQSPGEFALRGGILDVFSVQDDLPARIEFDGAEIASIRRFDPETQTSVERIASVRIFSAGLGEGPGGGSFFSLLPADALVLLLEPAMIEQKADEVGSFEMEMMGRAKNDFYMDAGEMYGHISSRRVLNLFPFAGGGEASGAADVRFNVLAARPAPSEQALEEQASGLAEKGYSVFFFTDNDSVMRGAERVLDGSPGLSRALSPVRGWLGEGFLLPDSKLGFLAPGRPPRPASGSASGVPVIDRGELDEGDYVVHINHGVGIYRGLKLITADGDRGEYLELEYLEGDRLYIPPSQIGLVSKYSGVEGHAPSLLRIDGVSWKKTKARAEKSIRDLAGELIELCACREAGEGFSFSGDGEWQHDFEEAFVYRETEGQLRAVEDIKKDMESPRPMDRLVCGDSGYGKTEVAVRAAFKCAMDGKQAAVLVPTTILAQQHHRTFSERMGGYPVNVAVLNRFKTSREQAEVIDGLKSGAVDIVIGTHRLIQKDIAFKDLGLVIIDEEQRFGVAQKEKLKKMRSLVDVLSMSATPIPRTLYMSLVGIRDISVIETPPGMRVPVEGRVVPFSKKLIRLAVLGELERGCQVFYLHNRVQTIDGAAAMLRALVPEARIAAAHGQMEPKTLQKVMREFADHEIDVLVSTTIIEAGLDMPGANTIIIERADTFGLADLYQLKGRVGRHSKKGSAFFMMPSAGCSSVESRDKLKAIQELAGPGSGLNTAMRDLELRGAGNLLGRQQHGHIAAVGFDLYCRLLRRAAAELKGGEAPEYETVLDLGFEPYIPESYVPDITHRVNIYRRLSSASSPGEISDLENELADRFGKPPLSVKRLLKTCALKLKAGERGVAYAGVSNGRLSIKLRDGKVFEETLDRDGGEYGILEAVEEKIMAV